MNHFYKCDPFSQVWSSVTSVTNFYEWDPFLQVWTIFTCVTHFHRCDPFFQVWPIFPGVAHFYNCDPFLKVRPIVPNVSHFSKGDPFSQVWRIFSSLTHFYKCNLFWQVWLIFTSVTYFYKCVPFLQVWPGAIIGDGDRTRALFQVLGLSLWYGTIFLFLEQIAPSCAAHAFTCCVDFCGYSAGKWRPKFPKCLMILAYKSIRSCLLEFCFSIFVVSCSSLGEVRQCRI